MKVINFAFPVNYCGVLRSSDTSLDQGLTAIYMYDCGVFERYTAPVRVILHSTVSSDIYVEPLHSSVDLPFADSVIVTFSDLESNITAVRLIFGGGRKVIFSIDYKLRLYNASLLLALSHIATYLPIDYRKCLLFHAMCAQSMLSFIDVLLFMSVMSKTPEYMLTSMLHSQCDPDCVYAQFNVKYMPLLCDIKRELNLLTLPTAYVVYNIARSIAPVDMDSVEKFSTALGDILPLILQGAYMTDIVYAFIANKRNIELFATSDPVDVMLIRLYGYTLSGQDDSVLTNTLSFLAYRVRGIDYRVYSLALLIALTGRYVLDGFLEYLHLFKQFEAAGRHGTAIIMLHEQFTPFELLMYMLVTKRVYIVTTPAADMTANVLRHYLPFLKKLADKFSMQVADVEFVANVDPSNITIYDDVLYLHIHGDITSCARFLKTMKQLLETTWRNVEAMIEPPLLGTWDVTQYANVFHNAVCKVVRDAYYRKEKLRLVDFYRQTFEVIRNVRGRDNVDILLFKIKNGTCSKLSVKLVDLIPAALQS